MLCPRAVTFRRALVPTPGHQPHHRQNDREGDGSAHLDQIALAGLLNNGRSNNGVDELTKLRPSDEPDRSECRKNQPASKPRGCEADQSEDHRCPPNGQDRGLLIHHLKEKDHGRDRFRRVLDAMRTEPWCSIRRLRSSQREHKSQRGYSTDECERPAAAIPRPGDPIDLIERNVDRHRRIGRSS